MAVRRTRTNPSGLPMQRREILFPVDVLFKLEQIRVETNKGESVLIREAVEKYVRDYFMKGDK